MPIMQLYIKKERLIVVKISVRETGIPFNSELAAENIMQINRAAR